MIRNALIVGILALGVGPVLAQSEVPLRDMLGGDGGRAPAIQYEAVPLSPTYSEPQGAVSDYGEGVLLDVDGNPVPLAPPADYGATTDTYGNSVLLSADPTGPVYETAPLLDIYGNPVPTVALSPVTGSDPAIAYESVEPVPVDPLQGTASYVTAAEPYLAEPSVMEVDEPYVEPVTRALVPQGTVAVGNPMELSIPMPSYNPPSIIGTGVR